ncbi:MAG TPA: radical SAM protein [Rhodocyclaceae bacterium]|nr:radical SAM protein [Rhodocyclaceae bacterium]
MWSPYPNSPISYIEPLFRPPSEARSLIFQVTNGCSWNKCTYCDMYTQPQKQFSLKSDADIETEIAWAGLHLREVRRVFLADGDAMSLSARRLLRILDLIRTHLPTVERVSSYCSSFNLRGKSVAELRQLREAGLKLIYMGAESGDDLVLEAIAKGDTHAGTVDALNRLGEAGIRRSVMIINGVGGRHYSEQHAVNSARLANATQPEYLSSLVINHPHGEARFRAGYEAHGGRYEKLSQPELFRELRNFVAALELEQTIFRSDHASNQLVLKGVLGKDKAALLAQIDTAIEAPQTAPLRPVWIRPF